MTARFHLDRRGLILGGAAAAVTPLAVSLAGDSSSSIPIGDMHAHLFFIGPKPASRYPLAKTMADGNATLVSWSLVGDMPWIRPTPQGLRQKGAPKTGESTKWFKEEIARVKQHAKEQKLKIVTTPADIERAVGGEPHVVLSVEGASFLDDGMDGVAMAYEAGIRHIQIVHFVRNKLGDFQTEPPEHSGLTETGRKVIAECNRLGILVDLAHCTSSAVKQALEVSTAPMVWSHSSIAKRGVAARKVGWQVRQLALDDAKAIAAKGGVVGLWGLRSDVGSTVESYGDRVLEMAKWIGDDHVAFGSDMNAVANSPVATYADMRRVVRYLQRQTDSARVRKIAIGNYARVLRRAMESAKV
jgi:membrane dipeptidase